MTDVGAFLSHYGVKGMKWGRRKEQRLQRLKRVTEGTGTLRDRFRVANQEVSLLDLARNKSYKDTLSKKLNEMEDRKRRTAEGKRIVGDFMSDIGLVGFSELGSK